MKHLEKQLEDQCRLTARRAGLVIFKVEKNGHTGIPDDIILTPDGRFCLVEFKAGKRGRVSRLQNVYSDFFGANCFIIRHFSEFVELLVNRFNVDSEMLKKC